MQWVQVRCDHLLCNNPPCKASYHSKTMSCNSASRGSHLGWQTGRVNNWAHNLKFSPSPILFKMGQICASQPEPTSIDLRHRCRKMPTTQGFIPFVHPILTKVRIAHGDRMLKLSSIMWDLPKELGTRRIV